jgi:5'-nucleotidase
MSLSGAQILHLLERQSRLRDESPSSGNMLQVSDGLRYRWDAARPPGQRLLRSSVKINGAALKPQRLYRVTVNSFLAQGGDGSGTLAKGVDRVDTGINDLDALSQYLLARERGSRPAGRENAAGRIVRVN